MPPKLKVGKKKGKGKRRKKGKKKKKEKAQVDPPPLHKLTELYNILREKVYDVKRTQNRARKKRLEGWYMTREMLNLKHDNEVYHEYLREKMEEIQLLLEDIRAQLEKERAEVDRLIQERLAEYEKKIGEYKSRMVKAEMEIAELKKSLLEFEPLIKKLAALIARLKELQAQVPQAMLEANIKTRYLKNQYLSERARLHNHLENELYTLVTTCRSHLMPILCDHMHRMEFENRCNRWALGKLDIANGKLSRTKELLLEKRNRLNMEKPYLSLDWAFNKLAQAEKRKKAERELLRHPIKPPPPPDECELAIAFKQYLNKKLTIAREQQQREIRMQRRREEKQRLHEIEQEKARKVAEKAAKKARKLMHDLGLDDEEEWDEQDLEWLDEELEYYENADGTMVVAPKGRMNQHKSLMENKSLDDMLNGEDEGEGSGSSSSGGSWESGDDDVVNVNAGQADYGQDDDDDLIVNMSMASTTSLRRSSLRDIGETPSVIAHRHHHKKKKGKERASKKQQKLEESWPEDDDNPDTSGNTNSNSTK